MRLTLFLLAAALAITACPKPKPPPTPCGGDDQPCCTTGTACAADAGLECVAGTCISHPQPVPTDPCELPGAWVHDDAGFHANPGSPSTPDYSWLTIPLGFCVHPYGNVQSVRQIRFAPGGELFAASPSTSVASGVLPPRQGAIWVIPDDNGDGTGDENLSFAPATSVQGLMFANGYFYFQNSTSILREPYVTNQRLDNGQSEVVVDINVYSSSTHWPKTLDIADDGTIYVGNGGDQGEVCEQPMPFHGGILEIDGSANGKQVAMGLRNPIAVRCHHDGNDHCFAVELAKDGTAGVGGREKLIPIEDGDNWGFPCCASTNLPYPDVTVSCSTGQCAPDCSATTTDTNSFYIGNTPFGLDFEDTQFPAPWDHQVLIALHGAVGSWAGARVVAVDIDAQTGLPLASSTVDGGNDSGAIRDFATGWDDRSYAHGRPADVAFSSDGRLFVSNDVTGEIFWIAPIGPRSLMGSSPDGGLLSYPDGGLAPYSDGGYPLRPDAG
jgi:glucose/arabinose dehydrogenase